MERIDREKESERKVGGGEGKRVNKKMRNNRRKRKGIDNPEHNRDNENMQRNEKTKTGNSSMKEI